MPSYNSRQIYFTHLNLAAINGDFPKLNLDSWGRTGFGRYLPRQSYIIVPYCKGDETVRDHPCCYKNQDSHISHSPYSLGKSHEISLLISHLNPYFGWSNLSDWILLQIKNIIGKNNTFNYTSHVSLIPILFKNQIFKMPFHDNFYKKSVVKHRNAKRNPKWKILIDFIVNILSVDFIVIRIWWINLLL